MGEMVYSSRRSVHTTEVWLYYLDSIDGNSVTNMDVFLEDDPALPCLPLVSRISVAYPLQSDSADGLIREAEQLRTFCSQLSNFKD